MKKCWAACLGDCSDKLSGEHIVTADIFSSDKVKVQGLPWCRDAPKEIGLASAVKNVLCTWHNSRLSPLEIPAWLKEGLKIGLLKIGLDAVARLW